MAVAEKGIAEQASPNPQRLLVKSSLLGALYVLFCLGLIFSGLPTLWGELGIANEFLSAALLLLVVAGVGVGLIFLGRALEKNPPHGFRAGVFCICVTIFAIVWLTRGFGSLLDGAEVGEAGIFLTLALLVGLVYVSSRIFLKPGFCRWLENLEDQGWFHAIPYKPNQGVRVRRGSMLGLLILGVFGIITLVSHRSLGSDRFGPNDWLVNLPFTHQSETGQPYFVPLMYRVHMTIPIVLGVALIWTSWRVVNWPVFADFLIATEAEMNKVSWTSRKRLVQDTIVVLVTVVLLTVFLFLMDWLWIRVLSADFIQVLRVDVRAEQQKQQEKTRW
jgi:preprotein translocase SecE subunit